MLHKVMLAGEWLLCNTLNINVVYTRQLGQSITCLSLPAGELGAVFTRWYPDMDIEVEEVPAAA